VDLVNIYTTAEARGGRNIEAEHSEMAHGLVRFCPPAQEGFLEAYRLEEMEGLKGISPASTSPLGNAGLLSQGSGIPEPSSKDRVIEGEAGDKGGIDLRTLPIVTQPMAAPLPALSMNTRVPLSAQEAKELEEEFGAIEKMLNAGIIPSTDRLKDYLGNCYDKQGLEASVDKVLACIADILRLEEERCLSTETALKELLQLLESDKPQEQFKLSLNSIKPLAQEVPGLDEFTYEDKRE
jgi:hypothetical protein